MRHVRALIVACTAAAILMLAPAAATAFTLQAPSGEPTQNAYGLWYSGQQSCAGDGTQNCHASILAEKTVHSEFVKNVAAEPSLLKPAADSALWPNPGFGGFELAPSEILLQLGDDEGLLEYVGPADSPRIATNPVGDLTLWDPLAFSQAKDEWEGEGVKITGVSYSQSCSQCHNLGVTRPSNASYTLPNGAVQSTSTPSGAVGFGIQCEVCHGSGKDPGAHAAGIPETVGGYQVLKSQVCGQCHVSASAPQKNVKGSAFGNPNGFTPDQDLSKYLTVITTTAPTEAEFQAYLTSLTTGTPLPKPKFLPNGDNYSMKHVYYNEWLANTTPISGDQPRGHASPTNAKVVSKGEPKCLGCHSGIGFLNRIQAKGPMGSYIATDAPSMALVQSSDPGISCQVCHVGHVGFKPSGAYDSLRKHADGTDVGCADCHNWQYEVLDQPLGVESVDGVDSARPAADTRIRHPQREMFMGGRGGESGTGGMWGVAPTGAYMSNVDCKDCHMPRTYREGTAASDTGGKDFTRVSHRFHVLLPGDAKRWKVRTNGDSCDPTCHTLEQASWNRDQYQQWIDTTKVAIESSSLELTQTLGAEASALGLGSWTDFMNAQPIDGAAVDLSAAEWKMLQKAAQNADFVINDASGGVHNPTYAASGIAVAQRWALGIRAYVDASSSEGYLNGQAGRTISGTVYGSTGKSLEGVPVTLQVSTDGTFWTTIASGTTGEAGFSLSTGPVVGECAYRVVYSPAEGVAYYSGMMAEKPPVTQALFAPVDAASGWVSGDVTFTLDGSDGLVFYALTGAQTQAPTIYSGPVTINAEGVTTVTYWSVSAAGSESMHTQLVRIDKSKPTVSCNAKSIHTESAAITVTGADPLSGVAFVEYAVDAGAWVKVDGASATVPAVTALGSHKIKARATDNLGAVCSEATWSFSIKATPKLTISPSSSYVSIRRYGSWKYALTVKRASGAAISGKTVTLQRSTNNHSWSTVATLKTNSSGYVYKTQKFSTRGTTYWRWVVPDASNCYAATGRATKLVVK